jgi:hypothetical protein
MGKVRCNEHITNAHRDRRELSCGHNATILPRAVGRLRKLWAALREGAARGFQSFLLLL